MLLVTGKEGQLGSCLGRLLPNAIFTSYDELDITNSNAVRSFVKDNNIETIINCAAYTAVDKAEDEEELADMVNNFGAECLARTGAKIIHISTDYVFPGNSNKPYREFDNTGPVTAYGRTKLAGEDAVLKYADTAVIIRTSWLYSTYGNNFVKTMLRLGEEKQSINVVCDQFGSPTYALDLAKAIVAIVPQISQTNKGIYHYSNSGQCSWFDFASTIMSTASLPCNVIPVTSDMYPTKANRPLYSVMDTSKLENTFGIIIPTWQESLRNMYNDYL